jgi:hypothetical protein
MALAYAVARYAVQVLPGRSLVSVVELLTPAPVSPVAVENSPRKCSPGIFLQHSLVSAVCKQTDPVRSRYHNADKSLSRGKRSDHIWGSFAPDRLVMVVHSQFLVRTLSLQVVLNGGTTRLYRGLLIEVFHIAWSLYSRSWGSVRLWDLFWYCIWGIYIQVSYHVFPVIAGGRRIFLSAGAPVLSYPLPVERVHTAPIPGSRRLHMVPWEECFFWSCRWDTGFPSQSHGPEEAYMEEAVYGLFLP